MKLSFNSNKLDKYDYIKEELTLSKAFHKINKLLNLRIKTDLEITSLVASLNTIFDEYPTFKQIILYIDQWCLVNTKPEILQVNKALLLVIFYPFIVYLAYVIMNKNLVGITIENYNCVLGKLNNWKTKVYSEINNQGKKEG